MRNIRLEAGGKGMSRGPREKLAIFAPTMGSGGAERSMLKLAGGVSTRGPSVDLVLARAEGPFLAEIPKSVRIVDLKARRLLTSLPALVRYLRREQPRAMLSVLNANIVALWARRLARVPTRIVVSERNTPSYRARQQAADLRVRLAPQLIKRFYPWADGIVAVSAGVADDLSRLTGIPRERIRVIYNPIITPDLRAKAQVPIEHPWFRPGQPPVILAVGSLTEQKDFRTLIAAFAQVRKNRPARLLILGEGGERRALEALAEQLGVGSDVSMPGFVLNPYPYMCAASVFVLSSRWEGLPGVLIEALYCGPPLISTDCPSGPREILADGRYGQLFQVGDVDALARAIGAALEGKTQRAPRESWRPFELDAIVNQYMEILLGRKTAFQTD